MKMLTLLAGVLFGVSTFTVNAATVDGVINGWGEYSSNTKGVEGSQHWNSFTYRRTNNEFKDASGGSRWDIKYMGTQVQDGKFHFGLYGGDILSGKQTGTGNGQGIFLGDIALGINPSSNPTTDPSDFAYAIRLLGTDNNTGKAQFALLGGGNWEGADLYNGAYGSSHVSATFRMEDATVLTTFEGAWSQQFNRRGHSRQSNTLEGAFDMSFLTSFDASLGGAIGTYLTMSCVNDEVSVYTNVDPVSQVPVPSALWLFSPVLVGFMALRRNKKQA